MAAAGHGVVPASPAGATSLGGASAPAGAPGFAGDAAWSPAPRRPEAPPLDLGPAQPAQAAGVACGACGAANPPGNRFCVACGARVVEAPAPVAAAPRIAGLDAPLDRPPPSSQIAVACSRCGGTTEGNSQYCMFCGASLRAAAPAPAAAAPMPMAAAQPGVPAPPPVQRPTGGGTFVTNSERSTTRPDSPHARVGPSTQVPPANAAMPPPAVSPSPYGGAPLDYLPPESPVVAPAGRLVAIAKDGAEGASYPLAGDLVDVGRVDGAIRIPDDPYLDSRHMRFLRVGDRWFVRDLGTVNGVYLRLRAPRPLEDGDFLLLGLQVIRFETVKDAEQGLGAATQHGTMLFGTPIQPRWARLRQRTVEGIDRNVYYVHRDETTFGREQGDIVFTHDPFMSRRHAVLRRDPASGAFTLEDLGSSNGTYAAIRGDVEVVSGDFIRVGQHLFRVDLGAVASGGRSVGSARRDS